MYKMSNAALAQRRKNVEEIAARRRAQTHCKHGHLIDGVLKNGRRYCRTCVSDRSYYWKRSNTK